MREISLTRGMVAKVDDADFDELSRFSWYAEPSKHTTYAARREGHAGPKIYMHSQIMNVKRVDHRDADGLNNQRSNLRECTQSQNMCNARKQKTRKTSSRYKGVSFFKRDGNWMAYIQVEGKHYHLGYFPTEARAAQAYNKAAFIHHGDFARFNEIEVAA